MNLFQSTTKVLMILITFALSTPALGWGVVGATSDKRPSKFQNKPVLLAKKSKKKKRGVRQKHISRERRYKGKDARNIDFDTIDIGGQRKTPMGSLISQTKARQGYDFVKIRLRWIPEMVQSASSLRTK